MEHKKDRASEYFKKELGQEDITKAEHFTYRDGFRIGLGFFIGFLVGSLALIVAVYLINLVFKAL